MHSAMDFLIRHGYIVIFAAVFVEEIGVPIPSDPVLLAAGALVGFHRLALLPVVVLAMAATTIPDCLWFRLGRRRGAAVLKFVCRVSIEPDTCVSKTHSAYVRYGPALILISKFVPWLGTLVPPMAGMFNLAMWKFVLFDAASGLVWAGVYIGLGWVFRRQLEDLAAAVSRFGSWFGVAVGIGILAYLVYKFIRRQRFRRALRIARLTPRELKQRMDAGAALVVIDLRSEIETKDGCIPGASALAYEELDSLLPAIGNKEVVFYCSCPDEQTSMLAALRLKRHGVTRVHPLLGGFTGWRDLGFPVEIPLPRAKSAVLSS